MKVKRFKFRCTQCGSVWGSDTKPAIWEYCRTCKKPMRVFASDRARYTEDVADFADIAPDGGGPDNPSSDDRS